MHYDKCAFSTDCPPGYTCACTHYTITVPPPNTQWQGLIGQHTHLSQLDGTGMAQRYTAPVVTTKPATYVASFSATLNGSVDPNGLTTSVYFQYGTTTGYGFTTAPHTKTGNRPQSVSANISGLTASTTYHFRIVATNSAGTRYGSDRTFTTLPQPGFQSSPLTRRRCCALFSQTQRPTRSAWVDHDRLFPIWTNHQLRKQNAQPDQNWEQLPECLCEHLGLECAHHLSFSNCSYQQCRHQVRRRQDLYHALATSDDPEGLEMNSQ